jgi:hypothetical protein
MNVETYITKWKLNLEKKISFIFLDRLKQPIPFAKPISFSPSSSEDDKENDINSQLDLLTTLSIRNRRDYIENENEGDDDINRSMEEEQTIEDYDDEYEQLNRPWYTRLRDITSSQREKVIIGEQKILSPTPTTMTLKDQPAILFIKMPLILPRYPRLLPRPQFYYE